MLGRTQRGVWMAQGRTDVWQAWLQPCQPPSPGLLRSRAGGRSLVPKELRICESPRDSPRHAAEPCAAMLLLLNPLARNGT